jgi:PhnB protein
MTTVNPYLSFNGNCEEAFNFYKSIFGGEFPYIGRYKDMPPVDGKSCAPQDEQKIMHISLSISKETILMGADNTGAFGPKTQVGNNIALSINTDSENEANRIFNKLFEGGNVIMPMNKTFWGAYFGMCIDKFGINWMVSYETNQNQ